jgi:hypothetical protein
MNTSIYSLTSEIGRGIFNAFASVVDRDDARVPADQVADLIVVLLFVAIGLLLTAAFCAAGFGPEIGAALGASG